jgi:hypothetical protein
MTELEKLVEHRLAVKKQRRKWLKWDLLSVAVTTFFFTALVAVACLGLSLKLGIPLW